MRHKAQRGFTLIEVIVTIILAAIMSTMMLSVSGTALRGNAEAFILATNQAQLVSITENITADYRAVYVSNTDPLTTIATRIGAAGSNQVNTYGAYTVVANRRFDFTGTAPNFTEQANTSGNLLRITIQVNNSSASFILAR